MDPGYNSTAPNRPSAQWYYITHAGTQVAQLDFQNKGRSRWTGTSSFVSEVPLCNLRPTMCNFLPRDRIGQRACCHQSNQPCGELSRVINGISIQSKKQTKKMAAASWVMWPTFSHSVFVHQLTCWLSRVAHLDRRFQTPAKPALRVLKSLRRKCCLCNNICKWLRLPSLPGLEL